MAVFSVDSDAVLASTAVVRATMERLQAEANSLTSQLAQLQATWTGTASLAFQGTVDQWRAGQRQLEDSLNALGTALGTAGRQYADAELATASLFR